MLLCVPFKRGCEMEREGRGVGELRAAATGRAGIPTGLPASRPHTGPRLPRHPAFQRRRPHAQRHTRHTHADTEHAHAAHTACTYMLILRQTQKLTHMYKHTHRGIPHTPLGTREDIVSILCPNSRQVGWDCFCVQNLPLLGLKRLNCESGLSRHGGL